MTEPVKHYALRLARSLGEAARNMAELDGISLNQFICIAIAEKISRLSAVEGLGRERSATLSANLKHHVD